jgi:RNA polymerase sigma factor (sigma-70 family)
VPLEEGGQVADKRLMKRPVVRLPPASLSDAELATLAAAGDEAAYEAIVRRYEPALRRYCRRLTRDGARADDAVQQALVSAWTALRQGAEVRELKPWLHRIAHNAAVRAATRERESPVAAEPQDQARSASAVIELSMETRAALTAVAALPEAQRAALVGTAIDGRSRGEMARELGLSEGAVRQLLHRARGTLREAIAALIPAGPAMRFLRRRTDGLPMSDAAPLAGGSAGAIVVTVCKVGVILGATGALVAVPVVHALRSRPAAAAQPVESSAGSAPVAGGPAAPADSQSQPISFEPAGWPTRTHATPAVASTPGGSDGSDPSAGDPNADGDGNPDTSGAASDSSDTGDQSADLSPDQSTDPGSDPPPDAAADPSQPSDGTDPAADTSTSVDPPPDPAADAPPADLAPAGPLLTLP